MRVPKASFGGAFSAAAIRGAEPVSGRTTLAFLLNAITASCWLGLRRAAKARSAATARRIATPAMLSLASTTSTTPNVFLARPARRNDAQVGDRPAVLGHRHVARG